MPDRSTSFSLAHVRARFFVHLDLLKLAEPSLRQVAAGMADAASAADGLRSEATHELPFDRLDEDILKLEARVKQEMAPPPAAAAEEAAEPPIDWRIPEDLISPPPAAAAAAHEPWQVEAAPAAAADAHDLEGAIAAGHDYGSEWRMPDDAAAPPVDASAGGGGGGAKRGKGKKRKAKDDSHRAATAIKKGTVLSLFQPTDVSNIGVLASNIFEHKSFCVMSTDLKPSKPELERLIVRQQADTRGGSERKKESKNRNHARAHRLRMRVCGMRCVLLFRRSTAAPSRRIRCRTPSASSRDEATPSKWRCKGRRRQR